MEVGACSVEVEHCKNVRRERGEQKKKKNYGI